MKGSSAISRRPATVRGLEPPVEERSITGSISTAAVVLAVYVFGRLRDQAVDEIIASLQRLTFRRSPRSMSRTGILYGPNREVLRRIELPESDGEDD